MADAGAELSVDLSLERSEAISVSHTDEDCFAALAMTLVAQAGWKTLKMSAQKPILTFCRCLGDVAEANIAADRLCIALRR